MRISKRQQYTNEEFFIGFRKTRNGCPSSATAPTSYEISGKWANTTAAINEITIIDCG